jgi:serine/threonine-protein kinase HipA
MADPVAHVTVQVGTEDVPAGRLWVHRHRRSESQTFVYDEGYLARRDAYPLDPALPLVSGALHTAEGRPVFGAFSDSAPDRWGRRLALRAERRRATSRRETPRTLGETDVLLAVRDDLRQGSVRFRGPVDHRYLADEASGVPTLLELPELLDLADRVDREDPSLEEDALAVLVRAGSSLGGARPKAHVLDRDGRIAIAKFPSPASDEWDVMRWEWTTLELARRAGITAPRSGLHAVGSRWVHVIDRFDRRGRGRIGYVSAMTMLEAADGDVGSYLDIADVIESESERPTDDLHELWRRVVFSVLVSNFDDHLRNHGFLRLTDAGWRLSPVFDVNPDPGRPRDRHLHTAIDGDETEASIALVLEVADAFRLRRADAVGVVAAVAAAVEVWPEVARRTGLPATEIEAMRPAFEHDAASEARALFP